MMQDLVGIVRLDEEMQRALRSVEVLKGRAGQVGVTGHREYNTGWHAAQDLGNLLLVSEAITRSAIERKESRGGHFRQDYPDKDPSFGTFNIVVRDVGRTARWKWRALRLRPCRPNLKQVIRGEQVS